MFILRFTKRIASLGIVLIAIAAVSATAAVIVIPEVGTIVTAHEGTAADLELSVLAERSSMFAGDGSFLTVLAEEENREPISLDDTPQEVIDAILTIEDADFYEHDGVNLRGTFRALVENINAGGITQGGSTITQQLVKISILSSEQNFSRKSTEAFYALRLERQMTKDEILERYLNTVYFGSGAYGIQAAAETYWGYEDASQLGWAESALLAAIIRNPTQFDPTRFPEAARERREVVLNRLVATGHLTEDEADIYKLAPLPAERQEPISTKPTDYFVEEALQALLKDPTILGGDAQDRFNLIYRGGLKIYTTFDPAAQRAAEQARADLLPETEEGFTVAIATVDTHSGAVRAVVGGPEFEKEKFNLATQGLRQPGSSMKTFVLAALFEAGFSPRDSVRADGPCSFADPTARNGKYTVGGRFRGRGTIAEVTRASNNCAFVRLGQVVGNDKVAQVARRLGISTLPAEAGEFLSLPLGVTVVHPMEMASAYAALGNDGRYNAPWYIQRVEDRDGNIIYQKEEDWTRAVSEQTARQISGVLESNVQSGTGTRAQLSGGHIAAGKTGTTNDFVDAWFVGYTDYYATAVWLGNPDDATTRIRIPGWNSFGGGLPATIWGAYMNEIHADLEPVPFIEPEPARGGRYLKVEGEIDFCDQFEVEGRTVGTELIDQNNDGRFDCFRPVTTTTTAPPPPEPEPTNTGQPENAAPPPRPQPPVTVPAPIGPGQTNNPGEVLPG
ncbi:MAG: transglycosylase domain-containing protein [Acidimicrobiales bacterium]